MRIDVEFNSSAAYPAADVIAAAKIAEEKGFSGVWEGEANNKAPMVLMSAVAAHTSRIQIGTAIVHMFGRSPATMGNEAATLDELTNGRFILGLGASNPTIAAWHGATFERPLTAIKEYMEIVQQTFQRKKLAYQGKSFSASGYRNAFDATSERLPIYVAALQPKMTALAGRLADGLMINMAPPDHVRKQVEWFRTAAEEAGRDPSQLDVVVKIRCCLQDDLEKAKAPMREACAFYVRADFYRNIMSDLGFEKEVDALQEAYRTGGFHAVKAGIPDALLDHLPVVATTDVQKVRERLKALEEAGATRAIIAYCPATNDPGGEAKRFLEAW